MWWHLSGYKEKKVISNNSVDYSAGQFKCICEKSLSFHCPKDRFKIKLS